MTLAVQTVRQVFNGNGSTTAFTIPFAFDANDEVEVILVSSSDVETPQTITTHYTISGSTLTMLVAPASGQKLLIRMDKDMKQQIADLSDQVTFLPSTLEEALDYIVSLEQQLNERINRCLTFPKSSTLTNVEMETRTLTGKAGYVLAVNDSEDAIEFPVSVEEILDAIAAGADAEAAATSAAASASAASTSESNAATSAAAAASSASAAASSASSAAAAAGTPMQEVLTGTFGGVDTTYTLSQTPNNALGLLIFLGPVVQRRTTDYTVSGTTITFAGADTSASDVLAFYRY